MANYLTDRDTGQRLSVADIKAENYTIQSHIDGTVRLVFLSGDRGIITVKEDIDDVRQALGE